MGKVKKTAANFYPKCEPFGEKLGERAQCTCEALVRQCFILEKKGKKKVTLTGPGLKTSITAKPGSSCAAWIPRLFRSVEDAKGLKKVRINGKHGLTKTCRKKKMKASRKEARPQVSTSDDKSSLSHPQTQKGLTSVVIMPNSETYVEFTAPPDIGSQFSRYVIFKDAREQVKGQWQRSNDLRVKSGDQRIDWVVTTGGKIDSVPDHRRVVKGTICGGKVIGAAKESAGGCVRKVEDKDVKAYGRDIRKALAPKKIASIKKLLREALDHQRTVGRKGKKLEFSCMQRLPGGGAATKPFDGYAFQSTPNEEIVSACAGIKDLTASFIYKGATIVIATRPSPSNTWGKILSEDSSYARASDIHTWDVAITVDGVQYWFMDGVEGTGDILKGLVGG